MAAIHFNNARVEVNSNDLSAYVKKVTLNIEADSLNTATMGDSWDEFIAGMKRGTVTIEFVQDFTDNLLDEILMGLFGTVVTCKIRTTSSAIGTSNPEYQTSVLVTNYSPINAGVGELATTSVTWPTSGAVTRATA